MALTFKQVAALFFAVALPALPQADRNQLTVAAAANLTGVAQELGSRFEAETGIHTVFSFGSTAMLTQQIENGAPFDVLLAADAAHVQELDGKGLLVTGSRAAYADGVLALWSPSPAVTVNRLEDLTSSQVRVISVAKPELAPYGAATIETLKNAGLLDKVKSKIVYADNINMAKQYGSSGNAEAVFTALSLVLKDKGKVIRIDPKLHKPIVQDLGIVASSSHKQAAEKFDDFILRGKGRAVLESFGYQAPQ